MDTKTSIILVSLAVIAWSIFAFFKVIPSDANGKKIIYKLVQVVSYWIFCGTFSYFILFSKLKEEDFLKFEFKYILTIFGFSTFILGLRWFIETIKVSKE